MPIVPTYPDRQVRTEALRPVMQQAPDVSSGARALAQGLGQVADVADRIDLRDAQDAAFKAQATIREEWGVQRAALRKAYAKDNADQYKVEADKWWAEAKTKYTAELNPRAQALAGRAIGDFKLAQDNDTVAYVEREKATARDVNFRTLQDTLIRDASATVTPANAAAVSATTADTIRKNAIRFAAAEGFSSDVGEKMAREQLDKYHTTVALMLAGRPGGDASAKEYLNQFGKDIPLDMRERVTDQIELTAERAKTKATKDLYGNLRFGVENGVYPTTAQYEQLRQLDPLSAATLKQAADAQKKAALVEAQGKEIKTDFAAWQDAYNKISTGQPVDLLQYRNTVSRADLMTLRKVQEDKNKPDKEKDIATTTQVMNLYTGGYALEKKQQFNAAFLDEINTLEKEKGRPVTYEEKRKIGQRLIVDGEVLSGSVWKNDPNKKYFQATPEERASFAPTLTSDDRKLVKDAFMAEGVKNPTEAQIVERFKLAKGIR
jgi:hypothetical protein